MGRRYRFSAAHYLENHPKCGKMHGHNYIVEIVVKTRAGAPLYIDFFDLDIRVRPILKSLDHSVLNDIIPYPTVENIALYIFNSISKVFEVVYVRVWETDDSWAEVRNDG